MMNKQTTISRNINLIINTYCIIFIYINFDKNNID